MQIVIELSEKDYHRICQEYISFTDTLEGRALSAVASGTPLPKGHGRLKDIDHYIKMAWEHPDYSLTDDEPTIIEADKS